jgi:hypothetical protein
MSSGALTVAGQWRIFTAFPDILVIRRDWWRASSKESPRRKAQDERKIWRLWQGFSLRRPVHATVRGRFAEFNICP